MSPSKTTSALSPMNASLEAGREPSIAEVLAEPIVRAVMRRDSISESALIGMIDKVREQLDLRAA